MSKRAKTEKTNEVFIIIAGIIHVLFSIFIALPLGFVFWLADGYCAGGHFCSRAPGALAFLGASIMVFVFSQFIIFALRHNKKGCIILTIISFVLAIILFIIRLSWFYN